MRLLRWLLLGGSLLATLALGIGSKLYDGPGALWVRQDLNGVFYTMAWAFGLSLLAPGARPGRLAGVALAVSCGLEALQLWHPHFLEVWRARPLGRLALGSAFAWSDFPYYGLGAVVAAGWLAALPGRRRREGLAFVRPPARMGGAAS